MNNLISKKELSTQQLSLVQGELEKKKKSKTAMYFIWFFLGGIGGHRYYLGDIKRAIFMTITLGGLGIWSLIDGFFIAKRLEQKNNEIESEIIEEVKLYNN